MADDALPDARPDGLVEPDVPYRPVVLDGEPRFGDAVEALLADGVRAQEGGEPRPLAVMFRVPIEGTVWSVQASVPVSGDIGADELSATAADSLKKALLGFSSSAMTGGFPPGSVERARWVPQPHHLPIADFARTLTVEQVRDLGVAYYARPQRGDDPAPPAEEADEQGDWGRRDSRARAAFAPGGGVLSSYIDPQYSCKTSPQSPLKSCRVFMSTYSWTANGMAALKRVRTNLTYEHGLGWCRDTSNGMFEGWSTVDYTGFATFITDMQNGYEDYGGSQPSCPGGTYDDMAGGSSNAQNLQANHTYVVYFRVSTHYGAGSTEYTALTAQHGHRTPSGCHSPVTCIFSNPGSYGPNNYRFFGGTGYNVQVPFYDTWK